jgi:hypothetical protein
MKMMVKTNYIRQYIFAFSLGTRYNACFNGGGVMHIDFDRVHGSKCKKSMKRMVWRLDPTIFKSNGDETMKVTIHHKKWCHLRLRHTMCDMYQESKAMFGCIHQGQSSPRTHVFVVYCCLVHILARQMQPSVARLGLPCTRPQVRPNMNLKSALSHALGSDKS